VDFGFFEIYSCSTTKRVYVCRIGDKKIIVVIGYPEIGIIVESSAAAALDG